ncbi:MAG: sulfatase-like hydrolase/transferase [Spirochaetes bacterium]|nr:sulfatase-like hydrolase/transferase [Spirochaetota bacterium]
MKRPNILLITSDQQHWNTLGCMNPEIQTPALDRLASEGVLFTRAYCPNPTCTPTRASIITGQYPSQHGAWSLGTKLPETAHTVGEDFQKNGYRTALIGKAHFQQLLNTGAYPSIESNPLQQDLAFWKDFTGPFYGFEHIELLRNHTDEYHAGQHYGLWMESKGLKNWRDYFQVFGEKRRDSHIRPGDKPGRGSWTLPEEYHYNAFIAERTNAMMDKYKKNDENFFLWASFPDPHPPYIVPEPWASMYDPKKITTPRVYSGEHDNNPPHHKLTQTPKPDFSPWQEKDGNGMHGMHSHLHDQDSLARDIALYYGMVSFTDKYVGVILDKLASLGLADNTIVVFTTDHGHFFGHHGLTAKGPFHYEDMIKVPFITRYPGHIPAGKRSAALQSLVDLPETFLDYTDISIPRTMTGVSQKAVWNGDASQARDHIIVENHHQPTTIHVKTYVNERHKLTVYYNQPYGELYDLVNDPDEVNNLWDDETSQGLKKDLLLNMLHAEMGKEPMWMPRVYGA